jgi:hypothetical protein
LSEFFCVSSNAIAVISHQNEQEQLLQCFPLKPSAEKENTMKRKPLSLLLVLLFLSSHTPLAFSQQASSNDWAVVQQIKTNERLVVRQKDGKQFKGEMIEATDTSLTIDRDGKPLGIPRSDVRQVYVISGKAQKGKWALIGAGIGAGAGTGIGATKYDRNKDDYEIYIYMGTLIGTGVGAVSGLLFGQTRRNRTMVYDAR